MHKTIKSISLTICSTLIFGAAACNGNGGSGKGDGGNGDGGGGGGGNFAVVSSTKDEPAGSNCAMGGVRVDIGLDNGDGGGIARDGTLQAGETDSTQYVCIEATPFPPITRTTALGLGNANCMFGGTQIDYGLDDGSGGGTPKNDVLEDGEIDGTSYACLPMPSNLVVRTVELAPGDPTCSFGGQRIDSGLDDGDPSGTASDGVLQDGESDFSTTRCNAAPDEIFTDPTGPDGTAVIDFRGSDGLGSGSGPGAGGIFRVLLHGGPLATSLELRTNGIATPNLTPTVQDFAAGAHPLVINDATTIKISATEIAGPHLRGVSGDSFALPLYDGADLVTSLDIGATGVVTFEAAATAPNAVTARVEGHVRNAGKIYASPPSASSEPFQPALILEAAAVFNEATGLIDSNGDYGNTGLLIATLFGEGGQIVNRGTITTAGRHIGDADPGYAAPLQLVAMTDIVNFGDLIARGADRTDTSSASSAGGSILVHTLRGSIFHYGTMDASAGTGTGDSNGGGIYVRNTRDQVELLAPIMHPAFLDESNFAAGDFHATGALRSNGNATTAEDSGYSGAGAGGQIDIALFGAIHATSTMSASGGDVGAAYGDAGAGGKIYITALTWVPPTGTGTIVVPSEIALSGSLIARGSQPASDVTANYSGASGGDITITLDAVLDGNNVNGANVGSVGIDRNALAALGVRPRIALYGYADVNGDGGNGSSATNSAGGAVVVQNRVCDNASCNFSSVGARRIVMRTPIHALGGTPEYGYSNGASGGGVNIALDRGDSANSLSFGASTIDIAASIDLTGGKSLNNGDGGHGGNVEIRSDVAAVRVQAGIDVSGGEAELIEGIDNRGGNAGSVWISGFLVSLESEVRANGGIATLYGAVGSVRSDGFQIAFTGEINASGFWNENAIELYAASTLTLDGKIVAQGRQSAFGSPNEGGYVTAQAGAITGSGSIDLDATDHASALASLEGGSGGYFSATAGTIAWSGAFTAKGANLTCAAECYGGYGGDLRLVANSGTTSGTINVRAGSATATGTGEGVAAFGGRGGTVALTGLDNSAPVEARGGNASAIAAATSGSGGDILITANNHAAVNASRGTASAASANDGLDGKIHIDGTNDACLTAEVIEPAGLPNFCI